MKIILVGLFTLIVGLGFCFYKATPVIPTPVTHDTHDTVASTLCPYGIDVVCIECYPPQRFHVGDNIRLKMDPTKDIWIDAVLEIISTHGYRYSIHYNFEESPGIWRSKHVIVEESELTR